ncbi:hypothetical protein GYMLUDRAFT_42357 [Collybiopsis luxurians FD-317 M1]|uniref:WW domain-containing protein n=1 Tax=Collybiopsis luxurians FD-317 M1 TaxID=944289 RepID=A0A0D0BDV8_9AGAR|nr:hypothetical protein GYMLUDRAFT_42357 [Collybiopsis luxurians FD-317 M1]
MQIVAPVNPDQRGLPPGWKEHYDSRKNTWWYIQTNVNPPRISYSHPCGDFYADSDDPVPISSSSSSNVQSSILFSSAGPWTSMSESPDLAPSPPIFMNTEQEVVHLPRQAMSAPDTADLTLPPEYSFYSESLNEPPDTNILGSDQPTRTQIYNNPTSSLPPEYPNVLASAEPVPSPPSLPPSPPQTALQPFMPLSPALLLGLGENQRRQPVTSQTASTTSSPAEPHLSPASVSMIQQVSSPPSASPAATTLPAGPLPLPTIGQQTSITTSMTGSHPNPMTPMNHPSPWVDVNVSHSPTPVPINASGEGMTVAPRFFASADMTSGGPAIHYSLDTRTSQTTSANADIHCTPENSFYSMGVSDNLQQQQQQYNLPGRGRPPANQAVGHSSLNSFPATSANTVVQPGPKVLPNFKFVASPEVGSNLISSMDQLSISSLQSLPGMNSNPEMQEQPGVAWVHSPPSPAPTSGGGWGHVVSAPVNISLSNPPQHLQVQAPIHHNVNSFPSPQGMQQQQNAQFQVPVASLPTLSDVYPIQGVPGNLASVLQSPSQPPQLFQYAAPTGYTPSSVPISAVPQPLLYPSTSLLGLPSQLPQSPPYNMLPTTASHVGHSLSSSLSPGLKKIGKVAGRVAAHPAVRYGAGLVVTSVFGLPPPPLKVNNIRSGLKASNVGPDFSQSQNTFASNPGVDYSGIIDPIGQQQQMNLNPGVNYYRP